MPAQSPTLSPTLSAITAGLRGSSSGMPHHIFPTRAAPTAGGFGGDPPPRRRGPGARVWALRVAPAAETREHGDERAAECEPDEIVDRRLGAVPDPVGEHPVVAGHAEEPEAHHDPARHRHRAPRPPDR